MTPPAAPAPAIVAALKSSIVAVGAEATTPSEAGTAADLSCSRRVVRDTRSFRRRLRSRFSRSKSSTALAEAAPGVMSPSSRSSAPCSPSRNSAKAPSCLIATASGAVRWAFSMFGISPSAARRRYLPFAAPSEIAGVTKPAEPRSPSKSRASRSLLSVRSAQGDCAHTDSCQLRWTNAWPRVATALWAAWTDSPRCVWRAVCWCQPALSTGSLRA